MVLFGETPELPRIPSPPLSSKVLLLAASVTALAGMVLLVVTPAGTARTAWLTTGATFDALAGLVVGCVLALRASRDYLLGLPGMAASLFVSIVLATFASLTLYMTGLTPLAMGANTSAARQHLAAGLALAGLLAAIALIAAPWSPCRKVVQPCLTAVAVLAPVVAVLTWAGPGALRGGGFGVLPGLDTNPILVVASVAGLLAIPLVVASSIEWVAACVGAGFRLAALLDGPQTGKRQGVAGQHWPRTLIVLTVLSWLVLGSFGWLPRWLGGHLGAWPLIRDAHPDAWVLVAGMTALAAFFIGRARWRLELPEAVGAAYVPTCLLFYTGVAASLDLLFFGARYVLVETLPAALPEIAASAGVLAFAVLVLWFAPQRRRPRAVLAGLTTCGLLTLVIGFLWPTGVTLGQLPASLVLPFGLSFLGKILDSAYVLAAASGFIVLFCLGAWRLFALWGRKQKTRNLDGSPAERTGYETVVLPLAGWALALFAGAFLRLRLGLLASAFTPPVLPDPVVFTMVAVPVAAAVALTQWRRRPGVARLGFCVVLTMPVIAFVPFAVPASLGPTGRLAVVVLAAPIIYGLLFGVRDLSRDAAAERRLGWLLGTTAIVVPLLAYLAVDGYQRGSLTSLLTETGQGAGTGLGAHLRLVLLLPLFVGFVMANPGPVAPLRGPSARSRALKADILAYFVRDHELGESYLEPLRRHLAAASPQDQTRYTCELADRLARWYTPPRRRVRVASGGGPGATADTDGRAARPATARGAPGYPRPESVRFALSVARRRLQGEEASAHDLARARSLVTRSLVPPSAGDRAALRAFDTVEVLRCALRGGERMSDACLDTVVAASGHELEDAAAALAAPREGREFARDLARARNGIDAQLASLPSFDFYRGMTDYVWFAPSVVLGELPSGVGEGEDTGGKPYLYIGAVLAAGVLLAAMVALFSFGGQLR